MTTPIASISEIAASQNNKYLTHNEALRHIEALSIGAVEGTLSTPPTSATVGKTWIVGFFPTGAWATHQTKIAQKTDTGWKFYPVFEGLVVSNKSTKNFSYFNGVIWEEIANGGNLSISDGTNTVNAVDLITINGSSIVDQGNGDVLLTLPASLSVSNGTTTVSSVDLINFTGATLTDNANGDITVGFTSSPSLSVIQGATTVNSVDSLTFTGGALLTNNGNGDATVSIPPSLTVSNGTNTVNAVDTITFPGATLVNQGGGNVELAIASATPLTIVQGATTVTDVDKITYTGATLTDDGGGDVTVAIPSLTVIGGAVSVPNTTTLTAGSGLSIVNEGIGQARIVASASDSLAFTSSSTRSLPYTLQVSDINKEIVVAGTGSLYIPLTATGFVVGWQCIVSLDEIGEISIRKEGDSLSGLVFSSQFNVMRSPGSASIVYRGGSIWKILGFFEV
ncbi:MAG: DUF2793 domain-containing protein [Waterburya sp.]